MLARTLLIAIAVCSFASSSGAVVPDMDFDGIDAFGERSHLAQLLEERDPLGWSGCCGPIYRFGRPGDIAVPVDYDGDGATDPAVFRPSYAGWFLDLDKSEGTDVQLVYGRSGDVPVPADYDGNGSGDVAVWRPSYGGWFIDTNRNGGTDASLVFGAPGDVPVPRDYDGDGRDDPAVFRAGRWLVDLDHDGRAEIDVVFGRADDVPMTGDFDGNGIADLAVYRPSWGGWYVDTNRNGGTDHAVPRITGRADQADEAIPTTGDYDGDGRTDLAVFFPYASWHRDVNLDQSNGFGDSTYACDLEFCRPLRTNGWALDGLGFFPAF